MYTIYYILACSWLWKEIFWYITFALFALWCDSDVHGVCFLLFNSLAQCTCARQNINNWLMHYRRVHLHQHQKITISLPVIRTIQPCIFYVRSWQNGHENAHMKKQRERKTIIMWTKTYAHTGIMLKLSRLSDNLFIMASESIIIKPALAFKFFFLFFFNSPPLCLLCIISLFRFLFLSFVGFFRIEFIAFHIDSLAV